MNQPTITGSTDSNGLFRAENPFSPYSPKHAAGTDFSEFDWFSRQHPPLLCYNENELVKGVEGLEVKGPFVQAYAMTRNGYHVWTTVWPLEGITCTKQEMKDDAIKNKTEYREVYIAVQPTEKAVEYTYTIDGKPCTEKQYHDTEYASNFIDVGHAEKHATPLPEVQPLEGVKTAALKHFATDQTNRYQDDIFVKGAEFGANWQKENGQFATDAGGGKEISEADIIEEYKHYVYISMGLGDEQDAFISGYKIALLKAKIEIEAKNINSIEQKLTEKTASLKGCTKNDRECFMAGGEYVLYLLRETPSTHSSRQMVERLTSLIETIKEFEITGDVEVDEDLYNQGLDRGVKEINKLITQILIIKR